MSDRSQHTERQPIPGAQIEDLNLNLVANHIATAVARRGYSGPADPIAYLQQHAALIEDTDATLAPTLAGILAFARDPGRWVDSEGVDIAQFSGTQAHSTELIFSTQVRGDLGTVIDRTVDILWARSEHRYRLEGTERIEEHAYPLVVLRELTVNAIAHRDWSYARSRVRVQLFPNRIEWLSPGGLPPGVTAATLRDEQVSRNPAIAQILYQSGRLESFGLGIDTVEDTLRAGGSRPLDVTDSGRQVAMVVYARPLAATETAPRATTSDRQITILAMIDQRGPLTVGELSTLLGVSRRTVQNDLRVLLEQGTLVALGETNNRRYQRP